MQEQVHQNRGKKEKIPSRPVSPRPADRSHLHEVPLSRGFQDGLIKRTESHQPWIEGPTCMQDSGKTHENHLPRESTSVDQVGETEG